MVFRYTSNPQQEEFVRNTGKGPLCKSLRVKTNRVKNNKKDQSSQRNKKTKGLEK